MDCDDTARETVSPGEFFRSLGYDILYFSGMTAVECFQPKRRSFGLRVDSAGTSDLGQTSWIVSTGTGMALSKGQDLIYLRLLDAIFLKRERAHVLGGRVFRERW